MPEHDELSKRLNDLREEFYTALEQRDRRIEEILTRYEAGEAMIEEVIAALKSFAGERKRALDQQDRSLTHIKDIGKKKKGEGSDH